MSAQGDNNLDNDTATDLLFDVSSCLSAKILSLFEDPQIHDPEEEPIGQLFVWIEVLFALHEARLLSAAPNFAQVKRFTDDFLPRWEASHHKIHKKPPKARRESIVKTFERLNAICKSRSDQAVIYQETLPSEHLSNDVRSVLDILNTKNQGDN